MDEWREYEKRRREQEIADLTAAEKGLTFALRVGLGILAFAAFAGIMSSSEHENTITIHSDHPATNLQANQ